MAWGATIWHPDGRVQFDSNWPALCLRSKGRASSGTGATVITVNSGRKPVVAIRPVNCNAAIETATKSGDNYSYTLVIYQMGSGGYCDWWVYDTPVPTAPTSGWVMAFFDENGNVTFNSEYPPMRPVPYAPQPAGRVYAIAPAIGPAWQEQVLITEDTFGNVIEIDWRTRLGGWRFDGANFYTDPLDTDFHFGLTSDQSYDPNASTTLLVDVTGH